MAEQGANTGSGVVGLPQPAGLRLGGACSQPGKHSDESCQAGSISVPRQRDLEVLTRLLVGELAGLLERPHILFGHSMGALAAYSVAAHRLAAGCRPPEALLITAFAAPHLRCSVLPADAVDDDELAQRPSPGGWRSAKPAGPR